MNILISSAGREVALVKSFKEALRLERIQGTVITVDVNPLSSSFSFSDASFLVPPYTDKNYINSVLIICKKYNVKLLIPTKDDELIIYAKNRERFRAVGTTVIVGSVDVIETCNDKLRFIKFCKKNKFDTPKYHPRERLTSKTISFPLFVNDRFGAGSRSAFKVYNAKQLELFLDYIKKPIVQDYIDEKEYTIDLFADLNGEIISVVPRERIKTFGGESIIGKTCNNKILIDSAIKIAKKLKLMGHNVIQCFFDGKNVLFIEINPRYGGASTLSFAADSNTPLFLVQLAKGKKLANRIGKFEDNLYVTRYFDDFFFKRPNVRKIY